MTAIRYAFEPFSTLQNVLNGGAIKIMPLGTFYRDERKLTITPDVLRQMESNFKGGLPRFRVPINENHAGVGKVGTVEDVAFLQDGADGPGLYATKYELTEAGKTLVKEGRFDAVSPEVVWSLNDGAQYQDPHDGQMHDNVLIGLALTDRPFFGHDNVALFSATQEVQPMPDKIDQVLDLLHQLTDEYAVWTTAFVNDLPDSCFLYIEPGGEKDGDGKTTPRSLRHFPYKDSSGKVDLPHLRNALARIPQSNLPADVKARVAAKARNIASNNGVGEGASENNLQMEVNMSDEIKKTETPPAAPAEGFSVTPDEFKALQEKAAQVETLRAQMETAKTQADEFKAQLGKVQYDRDLDRMRAHAEHFVALPIKADEMGKHLLDLQRVNEDLFKYFDGLLVELDKVLTQTDLFSQRGTARGETVETFEAVIDQVLSEKFNNDKSHYGEAMAIARERRPDLADAYINRR